MKRRITWIDLQPCGKYFTAGERALSLKWALCWRQMQIFLKLLVHDERKQREKADILIKITWPSQSSFPQLDHLPLLLMNKYLNWRNRLFSTGFFSLAFYDVFEISNVTWILLSSHACFELCSLVFSIWSMSVRRPLLLQDKSTYVKSTELNWKKSHSCLVIHLQ